MPLGLPSDNSSEWPEYRKLFKEKYQKPLQDFQNQLNQDYGYPSFPEEIFFNKSPYLNLYGFPKELDYTDKIPKPENFLQLDAFFEYNAKDFKPFEFPEEFRNKIKPSEKLIYISLGSCGPIDVELMKNIVQALRHSPYKCIVSKGPLHDQYELSEHNMWGDAWVDQRHILPMVDVVLFHGGNNTLTECVMHGKPMVVMPLFFDQYSNAQRIGIRLDPYKFTEKQLIDSIDQLLFGENGEDIRKNLRKASERMRQSKSVQNACAILEKLTLKQNE